ncbi:ABC transporter permease [Tunicatimonas pelagia]|uniref:ABC transporter permease n=1 Tax=Tunicatimonas pelagia TaxID=931531 RepID=UPI002666796A|nr:ABC transporter permease [Tunicatimonas pelagia]WKN43157.1 ABC transporter permease [Tunicatimonas pelagia]
MLDNNFKTAWRHLVKNKLFSFINVTGLAIGMAACLVIFRYVSFELSYDTFHQHQDCLYRVVLSDYTQGKFQGMSPSTVAGLESALNNTFSEDLLIVRLTPLSKTIVTYHTQEPKAVKFIEERLVYADPTFLHAFSFPLIKGDLNSALSSPHTAVISTTVAKKYFNHQDPIGKLLSIGEGEPFRVEGVIEDMPENSHLQFDFILSYSTLGSQKDEDWSWQDTYTYLMLPPYLSPKDLETTLTTIVRQHHKEGSLDQYHLQRLTDIYLDDSIRSNVIKMGNARTVYFLLAIGIVLMLMALINFVNLSSIKSLDRMKEIGIRRVMGANRGHLVRQFLVEAGLLNSFALLIGLCLIFVVTSLFEHWSLPHLFSGQQYWFWLFVGGLLLANTLISGLYPIFTFTFFPTALRTLKTYSKTTIRGLGFAKYLILFQFIASLVLLTGIIIIDQQLSYMRSQQLAIDISRTLIVQAPHLTDQSTSSRFEAFKSELASYSLINSITHSTSVPGEPIDWNRSDIKLGSIDTESLFPSNIIAVGYDFVTAYGLTILVGRDFQPAITNDKSAMLINEAAAKQFGFSTLEEGLGQSVFMGSREFHIIGVVNDYHHLSLKESIDPILYFIGSTRRPIYSIKLSTENLPTTLATIQDSWERMYPDNVFSYFFLDEFFDQQYRSDQQFEMLTSWFSGLTILLACMGLFGLTTYTAVQRTQEIGIRKVLGASVVNILLMLSKGQFRLIFIAIFVSAPIANYFFTEWLNEFAYRITIRWWMLVAPGILILLISLLTIARQTIKAANRNPIDSLRYE